jgi:hypothetical protein
VPHLHQGADGTLDLPGEAHAGGATSAVSGTSDAAPASGVVSSTTERTERRCGGTIASPQSYGANPLSIQERKSWTFSPGHAP